MRERVVKGCRAEPALRRSEIGPANAGSLLGAEEEVKATTIRITIDEEHSAALGLGREGETGSEGRTAAAACCARDGGDESAPGRAVRRFTKPLDQPAASVRQLHHVFGAY